ncbi:MAG: substrate-binding domain-containing protein [Paracoccaceae bacterium]|nr:substrate-binding domain-containing protein [Paracoccaceae bacterium]
MRILKALPFVALFVFGLTAHAMAQDKFIIVQSTTSTQNSGLFDYLLPIFKEETGIEVRVVAVGTGQAIRNARNGDGDVLLVHSKEDEEAFVAEGFGVERFDLMYNDFVIVGPAGDPAGIGQSDNVIDALARISAAGAPFLSRGDDSGTNKAELRLWDKAGLMPGASTGQWYRESGQGMGATLNMATQLGAYTLSDRATWVAFGNKGDFAIRVEGDPALFNQYGVTLVNPDRFANIKAELGQIFVNWLISSHGQELIGKFEVNGTALFFPNAHRD